MTTDTRGRLARRAWCAGGVLLFFACALGCMAAPFKARAVYGPELEFRAIAERDAFDELILSDLQKQPVCPIVIHLPGGDIGDDQLRTAKAMTDLGAREEKSEVERARRRFACRP